MDSMRKQIGDVREGFLGINKIYRVGIRTKHTYKSRNLQRATTLYKF